MDTHIDIDIDGVQNVGSSFRLSLSLSLSVYSALEKHLGS